MLLNADSIHAGLCTRDASLNRDQWHQLQMGPALPQRQNESKDNLSFYSAG